VTRSVINFIKKIISEQPLVLSHNDLWTANVLVTNDTLTPVYIDYETMWFNFPGYDIGKLMHEPCWTRPKLPSIYHELKLELCPTDDDFKDFLSYYLLSYHTDIENELDLINNKEKVNEILNKIFGSDLKRIETLDEWLRNSKIGIMVSAYLLTALGILLGKHYSKELDFFQFGRDEYLTYTNYKKELGF